MSSVKLKELQSLKGIAAIMVFFSHALNMKGIELNNVFSRSLHFFWDGSIGVVIFFVLSGFLIPFSIRESNLRSYFLHIIKKIIRLYPVYIITLISAWWLCNLQLPFDKQVFSEWFSGFWKETVPFKDLLPLFIIPALTSKSSLNPPIWTLYVEWFMIFIMPIILWGYRKLNKKVVFIVCIVGGGYIGWFIDPPFLKFRYIPMFVIGMYLCLEQSKIRDRSQKSLYKSIWWLILGCCLMNLHNTFVQISDFKYSGLTEMLVVLGVVLVIWIILADKRIADFLRNRKLLLLLGNISYEIYLTHFVILLTCRHLKNYMNWAELIILCGLVTLIISWLLHITIGKMADQLKGYIKSRV